MMYIPTDQETGYVTSGVWGNGSIVAKENRNGVTVLLADFPDGCRELDYDHFHEKGIISYARLVDDSAAKQQECVDYLENRNVKYLVHFTPIENLESIFEEGIIPRVMQRNPGSWTDDFRMDGHTDCSCFSISYPNYSMLYQKRKRAGMSSFAILLIDRNALLEVGSADVAYFQSNAADRTNHHTGFKAHTGLNALKGMFAENVIAKGGSIKRAYQALSSEYSTHPQAEILIKAVIPAKYIKAIVLYNMDSARYVPKSVFKRVKVTCDNGMFWPQGGKWADYEEKRRAGSYGYKTGICVDSITAVC